MTRKLLIIGANGFIGSHLSAYILAHRDWEIEALDIADDRLAGCLDHPRFRFVRGDLRECRDWIEAQVRTCDIVLPLAAIAHPATYVDDPLAVFELDFEANLEIVRHCVRYGKRVVFPSTSEVYGISSDSPYDEDGSRFITGPIAKERWIYSCAKQLMDRVIYAYGARHGLAFTLFRPFNWFGAGLDDVRASGKASRVVTKFLSDILHGRDIVLIDGGGQRRCFLYIDDAIEALMRILDNRGGCADGEIFNIGDPGGEMSIAELAEAMLDIAAEFEGYEHIRSLVAITAAAGEAYYGSGYQDIGHRVPNIGKAARLLGWTPSTPLREGLRKTMEYSIGGYSPKPPRFAPPLGR